MAEEDDDQTCPLCIEELDKNFLPCQCGYRVCVWCWHHIKDNVNGLCPACRAPYGSDPHAFAVPDSSKSRDNKQKKDKQLKSTTGVSEKSSNINLERSISTKSATSTAITQSTSSSSTTSSVTVSHSTVDRKSLHNYRVVQRNLVYVIGMPANCSNEDTLRKPEYFGQYGKITKVVVHKNSSISTSLVSVYVTYAYKEDAKAAIQALDGYWLDDHPLRASFGTTKYCNSFIRGVSCSNPECVYLHDIGDYEDRYTKEEIVNPNASVTSVNPTSTRQSSQLVTGCGGVSGTGRKISTGVEPILPQPIFPVDIAIACNNPNVIAQQLQLAKTANAKENSNSSNSSNSNISNNGSISNASSSSTTNANLNNASSSNIVTISNPTVTTKSSSTSSWAVAAGGNTVNSSNTSYSASSTALGDNLYDLNNNTVNYGSNSTLQSTGSSMSLLDQLQSNANNNIGGSTIGTIGSTMIKPIGSNKAASINSNINRNSSYDNTVSGNSSTQPSQPQQNLVTVATIENNILAAVIPIQQLPNFQYASFNGFSKCAVFPVPNSSFQVSVWNKLVSPIGNANDISAANPYNSYTSISPITELLDLTLPSVDAASCHPHWPKPLLYYLINMPQTNSHYSTTPTSNSNNSTGVLPPLPPNSSSQPMQQPSMQQQQQHNSMLQQMQQQQLNRSNTSSNNAVNGPTQQQQLQMQQQMLMNRTNGNSNLSQQLQQIQNINNNMQQQMMILMQQQQMQPDQIQQMNSSMPTGTANIGNGNNPIGVNNNSSAGSPNITVLQQLFPGVKMSFGNPATTMNNSSNGNNIAVIG